MKNKAASASKAYGFNVNPLDRSTHHTRRHDHSLSRQVWRNIVIAGVLLLAFHTFSERAVAQETSADILGTVTDSSGAIVPGVTVTLINVATQVKQTTTVNDSGDYLFTLLKPGTYSLTISHAGFKGVSFPSIALVAGDRNRENASLQAGDVTETLTITADTPLMQRESSTISSVVSGQDVQDLPLNGRNFINLVQITPGVNAGDPNAISSGNRAADRRATSTISANGQSDYYNDQLVDGMDNNERSQGLIGIRPSIDAIAEIKVDTNSFTAEVGRDAGAVVNVITKSGTNAFHGSLYEFFRNDIFDARDFFAKSGTVAKPEYRQNQFGGSLGGPIVKNKTFFFADVEDNRVIQGQTSGLLTVPTLYEEQHPGDFSDTKAGGPVIPLAAITATGLAYFKLFPAPNVPGAGFTNNFTSVVNKTQFGFTADGRVDHHFGNGDQLYGRYSYNNTSTYLPGPFPSISEMGLTIQPGGNLFGFDGTSAQKAHGFIFDYVHSFAPSVVLDLKAGYTRLDFTTTNLNHGNNVSTAFGVANGNSPAAPGTSGLTPAYFLAGGYAGLGDGPFLPINNVNNTFQYQGSLFYTRGKHTLKFGGELIRRQLDYLQNQFGLGLNLYAGLTGNAVADLLAGENYGYERGNTLFEQGFRMWEPSGYAEDDWRVTPSLTLNLGLRYDFYTPITEAHGRYANFNYSTLSIVTGTQDSSVGLRSAKKNFAPRIGFAQSLGEHTVVRGGYGISYYPTQVSLAILLANPPFSYSVACLPCVGQPLPEPVPSSVSNLSGSLSYAPSNMNSSSLQMFNLAVQQDFHGNVFTAAYVGELGRHEMFEPFINIPNPNGPYPNATTVAPPAPPPLTTAATLPNVTEIASYLPIASSSYNALQLTFSRRSKNGLSFQSNYTYARSLSDEVASSGQTGNGRGLIATNPRYDYGNSGNDIRHRFAMSLTYDLPFGKEAQGAKRVLIHGWSANFIDYWQTGLPFTVTDGVLNKKGSAQINLPEVTVDRPDVTGARLSSAHPTLTQYFNMTAFTPQAAGTAGNEAFDQLYGPNQRRADLSFFKTTELEHGIVLQFRAECYNISNTPNFIAPNSEITAFAPGPLHGASNPISTVGILPGDIPTSAGGFGSITQTTPNANPRQFQFGLKALF